MSVSRLDRYRGALLGLAVGDALGTTLEFKSPGTFKPINDMLGGGPFDLNAGQWTDDTSMALCLAESLAECKGFNADDQMRRYVRWWKEGYLSSTGTCFDIGGTVMGALKRYIDTGDPYSGSIDKYSAGNGSLMRLAPISLYYATNADDAIHYAAQSSKTTHGANTAIDACRYFSGLLIGAISDLSKDEILSSAFHPAKGNWDDEELVSEIYEIAMGSFKLKSPPEIKGTGYVVESMEAALWAFYHTDNYKDGSLMAVNLGDDADTTGAIYGQLAGVYYGMSEIPKNWIHKVSMLNNIICYADKLYENMIEQDILK